MPSLLPLLWQALMWVFAGENPAEKPIPLGPINRLSDNGEEPP